MTRKDVLALKEPFVFSELEKKGFFIRKKELEQLVQKGNLNQKKIGRMTIYWSTIQSLASEKKFTSQTGLEAYVKQLELEVNELKQELMTEREKVKSLQFQEGIDDPWKDTAMAMASVLSEQKQISIQEVLDYFNAPFEE
ncbi:MAG: hypothetical protein ACFFAU_02925 [Candidatus Hodarchaeota archaeon]